MSKNFLNFLTTSVIILSCGTAINSSSCYCMENKMESKKESTMDETNNISTNISQQDDSFNTINETPQNNNLQIKNIPVQNTFNSKELIATTDTLFTNGWYYNKKNVSEEIKNYTPDIKAFYQSDDVNTLKQLTKLVYTTHNNSCYDNSTALCHNVKELQSRNIITFSEAQEILEFNLLLHIMTDIETYNEGVQQQDAIRHTTPDESENGKSELIEDAEEQFLVNEFDDCHKKKNVQRKLWREIEATIRSITELLIPQYFVLDKLETWITRDELTSEIKDYIQSMCKYFDSLPIIKQILNAKNIKSIYYMIPEEIMNEAIYYTIKNFFCQPSVKNKLKKELNNYIQTCQESQHNKALKDKIKSKYIIQGIFDYAGQNMSRMLAKYKTVPGGMHEPGNIRDIVRSYLDLNKPLDVYCSNVKNTLFDV